MKSSPSMKRTGQLPTDLRLPRIPCLEPPLRWPGGKRWLVPLVARLYSPYRHLRLVDPFCGGLSIALGLRPKRARLSDLNPGLIVFYQCLQSGLVIDPPLTIDKSSFLAARARYNQILGHPEHSREQASLFYALNRTCYRGTSRVNDKGELNCTFGNVRNRLVQTDFRDFNLQLQSWDFRCADSNELVLDHDDFVYADPPYDGQTDVCARRSYRWEDHIELAELLSKHQAPVVVSNSGTARLVDLYQRLGFHLYHIAGGPAMPPKIEILAMRNLYPVD